MEEFHCSGGHWIYKSGFFFFKFCLNLEISQQLVMSLSATDLALLPALWIPV